MRILVTGAAGMLGQAVMEACGDHDDVVGVDLPDGDLTEPEVVAALWTRHRPDWVLHTAAYTDVDGAEAEPDLALAVNGEATANLARACKRHGTGLTYLSTDYVFDGEADGYDEDAVRRPINAYGWSKARGEEAVESLSDRWQIVRTSWLFGHGPRNFVLTIRRLLEENKTLRVVDDQIGCPTYTPDLANVLVFLAGPDHRAIFHGTNQGVCTWYEFAQEIARQTGHDPERIMPCATMDYPRPARRPNCSILRSQRLEEQGCPSRPPWQDGLRRYLAWLDGRSRRH